MTRCRSTDRPEIARVNTSFEFHVNATLVRYLICNKSCPKFLTMPSNEQSATSDQSPHICVSACTHKVMRTTAHPHEHTHARSHTSTHTRAHTHAHTHCSIHARTQTRARIAQTHTMHESPCAQPRRRIGLLTHNTHKRKIHTNARTHVRTYRRYC